MDITKFTWISKSIFQFVYIIRLSVPLFDIDKIIKGIWYSAFCYFRILPLIFTKTAGIGVLNNCVCLLDASTPHTAVVENIAKIKNPSIWDWLTGPHGFRRLLQFAVPEYGAVRCCRSCQPKQSLLSFSKPPHPKDCFEFSDAETCFTWARVSCFHNADFELVCAYRHCF